MKAKKAWWYHKFKNRGYK